MIMEIKRGFGVAVGFLRDGVWDADLERLPPGIAVLVRILRVIILMFRGIKDDELLLRASALTYITLVSIVPMLSIAMALSKGLGYNQYVLDKIAEFARTQPANVQEMVGEIIGLVESTNFQSLGWFGVAFLIVAATLVLNGLEKTLNRIWGIARSRNMLRRISNYISLLFVIPIFIGIAGTVQGMGIAMSEEVVPVGKLYGLLTDYMPFISTCLGLTLLYVMLPNTKIGWMPALISGIVGAAIWILWQKAFVNLQLSVVKYNAIYGTFASIPIFLVWLHTSWVIILLGAEVGFAVHYHNTLHVERDSLSASPRVRQLLALSILEENASIFEKGGEIFDKARFADRHKVPIRLVNDVVELLQQSGLLLEVAENENCYALARSPESIQIRNILDIIGSAGKDVNDLGMQNIQRDFGSLLELADHGIESALGEKHIGELLRD